MATVTGYTSARMKAIEDQAVVGGSIVGDNLILTRYNSATINAGNVRGPQGVQGPDGAVTIRNWAATDAQKAVVGNGVSKPLSGYYSTLAAAQAAYPHVTALTDTLDWAVIQAAINTINIETDGYLYLPPGIWDCNKQVILKSDVHLVGAGFRQSYIRFTTSLGTNVAGIDASTATSGAYAPTLTNLAVTGPAGQTRGNPGTNFMWGVKLGGQSKMTNCQVNNFWAGVVVNGDHNIFTGCKIGNNYHNVLWPSEWQYTGNHQFNQCDLTGAYFSCCTVQGGNLMDGCQFNGGHVGFAPYGFYKYDGGAPSTYGFMSETEMHGLAFEAIGNAGILDESTGGAGGADSLTGVVISNPGFAWNSFYKIAERPRDYAVNVRNVNSCTIFGGTYPFDPGDISAINIAGALAGTGLTINSGTGPVPVITGNAFGVRLFTASSAGPTEAVYFKATSAITSGNLVESSGPLSVQNYGIESRAFAGVALLTGVADAYIPVARRGLVNVNVDTEAVAASGVPLIPSILTPSKVAPASGLGNFGHIYGGTAVPNKHPIIGYSYLNIAANAVGKMWLEAPRADRLFVAPGAVSSLPVATSARRGQILRVEGAAGVADMSYMCKKDAANAYSWVAF